MSKQVTALTDGEVPEVSIVPRGAQGKRIASTKSEANMPEGMENILKEILEVEADGEEELEKIAKARGLDQKAVNAIKAAIRVLSAHKDVLPKDVMGVLSKALALPKAEHEDGDYEFGKPKGKRGKQDEPKPGDEDYPPPKKKADGSFEFGDDVPKAVQEQLTALWKSKAGFEEREKAAVKKAEELETILKAERDERRIKEFVAKAEKELPMIPGKAKDKGRLLKKLHDFDEVLGNEVESLLQGVNKQLGESKLYESLGSARGQDSDALAQITSKAAELRKSKPDLTKEQAFARIVKSEPALRKAYYAEKGE